MVFGRPSWRCLTETRCCTRACNCASCVFAPCGAHCESVSCISPHHLYVTSILLGGGGRHVLSNDVNLPARVAQLSIQERTALEGTLPTGNTLKMRKTGTETASGAAPVPAPHGNGVGVDRSTPLAGDAKAGGDHGHAGTAPPTPPHHHSSHRKHRNADTYLNVAAADVPDGMFKDHVLVCGAGSSLVQLARAILSQPFVPLQYSQADSLNSILDNAEAATWDVVVLAPASARPP